GQKICLYGVDDIWGGKTDYSDLMKWNSNYPVILISHNPDAVLTWPEKLKKPDLVLAGHTHGGQIRLPFIGPLGEADVALGKKYYKGLNYWNDIPIFVTVGVSETGGPVRFLNPPEVAVITLDGSLPLH
ncbi:MAG: metallophosphoesterase, partial [Patescibacteria group bacterium]